MALHALTDAILGALCLPDIGQLFPDTDPKWKGANSDTFIKEAVRLLTPTAAVRLAEALHQQREPQHEPCKGCPCLLFSWVIELG